MEDPVQNAMGDFGRWQKPAILMIYIYKLALGWHTMAVIFLGPKQNFTCATPNITDPCSPECLKRDFDTSTFTSTIISEWDLVCERKYFATVHQSVVMLGVLLGSIIFGALSDKLGRKLPLFVSMGTIIVTGILTAFCPWFWLFLVARFVNALGIGGGLVVSFVSMMEIIGKPHREVIAISYQLPFWLGHLTLPLVSYFIRNWQGYQLAISVMSCAVLPAFWFISESPRWLFSTGKIQEAADILETAAKVNKLPTEDIFETLEAKYKAKQTTEDSNKGSFIDLFKGPVLRRKTICISYNWLSCSMGYYGIVQYAGYLGGNVFANVAISGALEIPGTVICIYMTKYWGRKATMIIPNLLTGISMLIIACLPNSNSEAVRWTIVSLVSLGVMGMTMAFANAYLYSGELFPTVVRNVGVGTASMIGRIGAIIAPFIANVEQLWISSLIFGIVPIIGAILCLFLPETRGKNLPETLEDAEKAEKKGR